MARDHWAEFRPRMVAHLKKEGVYLAALLNAQEQASAMIAEQVSRLGNDLESAREMALAQFVLLRSEKEQPVLDADSMPYSQPEPPSAPTMWVPDLRLSRAAALAVPLDQDYHEAIRDKLVGLLERAGKRQARAAVQAYLEREERDILAADYPDGWAEEILATGSVGTLVMSGDPECVEPADAELAKEALEKAKEIDLEAFLEMAPSDRGLD